MAKVKKKLNILMVSDYPLGEIIGGSVRVLYEQSKRLEAKGHQVHILTRDEQLKKGYNTTRNMLEWKYSVNNKNTLSFFLTTLKNSKKLFIDLSKKYKFNFINFHQPISAFSIVRSPASKNIKKIYTCHSLSFEEFQSRKLRTERFIDSIFYQFNISIRKYLERSVLQASDKIIVLSHFTANKLTGVYGIPTEKISIIPGGVDLERFHPNTENGDIRKRLKISNDRVVLFTVRNLVKRMGLENLIVAFRDVVKKAPDIHLILGGEGPLKKALFSLANKLNLTNYISFVGFIEEDELPKYYQSADIFVLPTKELEGFGLVTLEALASGVPVLGTPVGGTEEILGKFDRSFIFSSTEANHIGDLILEKYFAFKANPKMWMEVKTRCREFVEGHYSWEKNIDSIENLFTEISK